MWVNTNNTELRDARDWQSIYSGVGSNWWDADLSDKQRAWFEKHYSRDENEPRYLEVWNADGTRKEPT